MLIQKDSCEQSVATSQWKVVADAVRQGMLNGEYVPGQRLAEDDLARRYSSSRFLVRRALDQLAAEDLVDQLPNRGARLRQPSVATAIELYTARGALDALVATEAASIATSYLARSLTVVRGELVRAAHDNDVCRFGRARAETADLLGAISGQVEGGRLAKQTTMRLWWYRRRLVTGRRPPHVVVNDIVTLIDAVHARDATAAREAVSAHLSAVCVALRVLEP